jgi:hypothetical protein
MGRYFAIANINCLNQYVEASITMSENPAAFMRFLRDIYEISVGYRINQMNRAQKSRML